MLFTSLPFLVFFVICYLTYWRIGTRAARQWLLVAASLFFYGWWDYRFLALMLFVAVVAYLGALGISRCRSRQRRRLILITSQSLDDSLTMLRGMAGIGLGSGQATMPPWVLPAIVLPVIADAVLGRLQTAAPGSWELRLGWPAYAGFTGIAAALFLWLVPLTSAPFIYFQF